MIDFILHIDKHLLDLIRDYGTWVYGILFLIVFCETGLVVTPFLPGDSLLFAAGVLSHGQGLDLWVVSLTFICAALLGDNVNYFLGKTLGPKLFKNENSKLFKRKHLDRTHEFFEEHGGKTIIIGRFVPIVRTFAPFVAGMGSMTYGKFIGYSVIAALLWVVICVGGGYLFGTIPAVRENFSLAILGMIAISLVPAFFEIMKHRRKSAAKHAAAKAAADEAL